MDNPPAIDTPPRPERRDARENRDRLLVAAKQLFGAQGIDATSMYEIARAAGVGQGTLYRHFADKGEICHALIKEDLATFMERVGGLIGSSEAERSPLARLDTLIAEKNRLTESHLPLFAVEDDRNARHAINNLRIPERRRGARSSEARTSVVAASTSLGKAPRLRSGMREH